MQIQCYPENISQIDFVQTGRRNNRNANRDHDLLEVERSDGRRKNCIEELSRRSFEGNTHKVTMGIRPLLQRASLRFT